GTEHGYDRAERHLAGSFPASQDGSLKDGQIATHASGAAPPPRRVSHARAQVRPTSQTSGPSTQRRQLDPAHPDAPTAGSRPAPTAGSRPPRRADSRIPPTPTRRQPDPAQPRADSSLVTR